MSISIIFHAHEEWMHAIQIIIALQQQHFNGLKPLMWLSIHFYLHVITYLRALVTREQWYCVPVDVQGQVTDMLSYAIYELWGKISRDLDELLAVYQPCPAPEAAGERHITELWLYLILSYFKVITYI